MVHPRSPTKMSQTDEPTTTSRLWASLVGMTYLMLLAALFRRITGTPLLVTLLLVLAAAGVIVIVFAMLSGRFVRTAGQTHRFRLSSIFLMTIPFSIYLSAVRIFCLTLPANLPALAWILIAAASCLFMIFSTIILMRMAEALVWVAVYLVRIRNEHSTATLSDPISQLSKKL